MLRISASSTFTALTLTTSTADECWFFRSATSLTAGSLTKNSAFSWICRLSIIIFPFCKHQTAALGTERCERAVLRRCQVLLNTRYVECVRHTFATINDGTNANDEHIPLRIGLNAGSMKSSLERGGALQAGCCAQNGLPVYADKKLTSTPKSTAQSFTPLAADVGKKLCVY